MKQLFKVIISISLVMLMSLCVTISYGANVVDKNYIQDNTKDNTKCSLYKVAKGHEKYLTTELYAAGNKHKIIKTCGFCDQQVSLEYEDHVYSNKTKCDKCGYERKCEKGYTVSGHEGFLKHEIYISSTNHAEVIKCTKCATNWIIENAEHTYTQENNTKCVCGYEKNTTNQTQENTKTNTKDTTKKETKEETIKVDEHKHKYDKTGACKVKGCDAKCSHENKTIKYSKNNKNINVHTKKETCKTCGIVVSTEEEHSWDTAPTYRRYSASLHQKTEKCSMCKATRVTKENHLFDNTTAKCVACKRTNKCTKLSFTSQKGDAITINSSATKAETGDVIELKKYLKITPVTATVNLKWNTGTANLILVDEDGKVELLAAGKAKVTVTDEISKKKATLTITISQKAVDVEEKVEEKIEEIPVIEEVEIIEKPLDDDENEKISVEKHEHKYDKTGICTVKGCEEKCSHGNKTIKYAKKNDNTHIKQETCKTCGIVISTTEEHKYDKISKYEFYSATVHLKTKACLCGATRRVKEEHEFSSENARCIGCRRSNACEGVSFKNSTINGEVGTVIELKDYVKVNPITATVNLEWNTETSNLISVDEDGKAELLAAGKAKVTVTDKISKKKATMTITIIQK